MRVIIMFFTPALAGGLPLDSEEQKVSSSLLGASQHLGRSHQYNIFMVSILPPIFNPSSLFKPFGNSSKCSKLNWYNCHPHTLQFFSSLVISKYLFIVSISFFPRNVKIHPMTSTFLSCQSI